MLAVLGGCSAAEPCTITDNADGTRTLTCPGSDPVIIQNGQSCTVVQVDGGANIVCEDGSTVFVPNGGNGTNGTPGSGGTPGTNGQDVLIETRHGIAAIEAEELAVNGKYLVNITITSASAAADGTVVMDFKVVDGANNPVNSISAIRANVAKLSPPATGEVSTKWVPYIWRTETVADAGVPFPNPIGTVTAQGNTEANGRLDNNQDGTYRYTFANNISAKTIPAGGGAIAYERNLLHRVSVMLGGHNGPTGTATFDFVPDGSAPPANASGRHLVDTATCQQCHGFDFHGHGGDRRTVENCDTCHTPGTTDAQSGNTLDMKVMIHKIHAGGELQSIPGADGKVWDDPTTTINEQADNGSYAIWGFGTTKLEWWKAEFPAVIANCTKCHTGSGAEVDNWKTNPSRAACGSCHDQVNFVTGAGHPGGAQANDNMCASCHQPDGAITGPFAPIIPSHDWTTKDPRNIPEHTGVVTLSAPANGQYFVAGESPVVTVVLSKAGTPIDHTTVVADTAAEGCTPTGCPASDGLWMGSNLFVSGPRDQRVPVLTTKARVAVFSTGTGPWDLSATSASLILKVDNGEDLWTTVPNGNTNVIPGTITVLVSAGTFVNKATATADEIVTWLNANSNFQKRALAYLDNGRVAIRSRNKGKFFAVQLQPSAVTTAVFNGDTTVKVMGGSTVGNPLAQQTNPANNDPKVTWATDKITYQLDPVDDLAPGTYTAYIEMTDRGRIDENNYQTPTVAIARFQVKQAAEEKPPANNCNQCHQSSDGKGFVLDYSRHNKIFEQNAVDRCGSCHDYQPQNATGDWSGAGQIARRVHGVHMGANLNYPLSTVGYSNGDPVKGRNWEINFPQDIRTCDGTCHGPTTSGSWKTQPSRLPCMGCHDSDAARAHIRDMTWDPTPLDPFSGDEQEACKACHAP